MDTGTTTLIITVLGFAIQYIREARAHKWAQEDRQRIAAESREATASSAKDLAVVVADSAKALAKSNGHTSDELKGLIASNTDLTKTGISAAKDAYVEANSMNEKLKQLGLAASDKETP